MISMWKCQIERRRRRFVLGLLGRDKNRRYSLRVTGISVIFKTRVQVPSSRESPKRENGR